MKIKKTKVLGFLTFLLLTITIFSSCGGNDMQPEKVLNEFLKLIESGKVNNCNLTIYYINPYILADIPLNVDGLINHNAVRSIIIDGNSLQKHNDLFNQLIGYALIPVKHKSYLDARLCYIFETVDDKILTIAMWGNNNNVFVNGLEVEENDVFYDIIKPFLPEDAVKDLEAYIGKG